MVNYKKIIAFLILFFTSVLIQDANAQENILGDTVFVNEEAEVEIVFPTVPNIISLDPVNAPYNIKAAGTSVITIAKSKNTEPATLIVSEGGRQHTFYIIFKEEINTSDIAALQKDYSTLKKLRQHVKETVIQNPAAPIDTETKVIAQNNDVLQTTGNAVSVQPNAGNSANQKGNYNDSEYFSLMAQGYIYLDQKKYSQAQDAFKQALNLKPGNVRATNQLKITNDLFQKDENNKELQRLNDQYSNYMSQAEIALNNNKLTEARTAFILALDIRKNDVAATKGLQLVEIKNNYDAAIQEADKLFNIHDYDNAIIAYNKALSFMTNDYPKARLKEISKIKTDEILSKKAEENRLQKEAALKESYLTAIKKADLEFENGNYLSAENIYSQASNLMKLEDYPKNQIIIIENILTKLAADKKANSDSIVSIKDKEKNYKAALLQGKSSFAKKDYLKAKTFYETAAHLKPMEDEPKSQLEEINIILAEIELLNHSDISYNNKIIEADKLKNEKMYDSSLEVYKEAAALKPLETYPQQQIRAVKFILNHIQKIKEYNEKVAKVKEYNAAILDAAKATNDKNFYKAKSDYIHAQAIHRLTELDSTRFEIILYQIGLAQSDSAAKVVAPPKIIIEPTKSKKKKNH